MPRPARAQTYTWTGTSGNNWGTSANWDANAVPNSATTLARFQTATNNARAILDLDYTVYGVVFDQAYVNNFPIVTRFTVTGNGSDNALNLYAGGITNNTNSVQYFDAAIALRASQSFTSVAGASLSFLSGQYNQISLLGNTLTIAGAGDATVASKIVDGISGGKIVKSGTGTLTLTGTNTYSGTTTITGGTLLVNAAGALGSQGINGLSLSNGTNGGVFGFVNGANTVSRNFTLTGAGSGFTAVNSGDVLTVSGKLTGSALTIGSAGTLGTVQLTGANTYTGGTTIAGGTLLVNSASAVGTGAVSLSNGTTGGVFGFISGANTITSNFAISGSGGGFVAVNAADVLTVSGVVSGSGNLAVGNANAKGTVVLSGANTYSGGTTISGGTLQVATNGALGSGAIVDNANLLLTPSGGNANLNIGSVISGSGSVTVTGSSSLNAPDTVNLTGLNTYTGGTTLTGVSKTTSDGTTTKYIQLKVGVPGGASGSLGTGPITLNANGFLFYYGASSTGSSTVTMNAGSIFNYLDSSTAANSNITNNGYLAFHNSAHLANASIRNNELMMIFDGVSAESANITNAKSLRFTNSSTAGNATIDTFANVDTIGLVFNQTSTADHATINSYGYVAPNGAVTTGFTSFDDTATAGYATINIYNAGKVGFTGSSTADNATVKINAGGTLTVENISNAGKTISIGSVSGVGSLILGGTTLTLGGSNTSDTLSGAIVNGTFLGGGLTKIGSGTLTLSGNSNDFSGNVTVAAGTLVASGSNSSTASPATSSLGSLSSQNPYTNSARVISVGGGSSAATLQFGANDVLGNSGATPGVLLLINPNGTVTNNGSTFNVLGAVTLTGGTLTATEGLDRNNLSYGFRGDVNVGGRTGSTISSSGQYGGYNLNSSTTFNVADVTSSTADLTVSGVLADRSGGAGTGSVVKAGAGTMVLSGANTYRGGTTITGGALSIGADNNVGTGSVTLNGGTLQWTGASETFGKTVTLGNATSGSGIAATNAGTTLTIGSNLTGSGGLTLSGAGTVNLTGNNTYTGVTTLSGGILNIGADSNVGTGGIVLNGGTLRYTGASEAFGKTLSLGSAASSIDVATTATNLTVGTSMTGSGSLTKTGAGTLIVTGANTYTGNTTVSAGTLQLGDGTTSNGSVAGNIVNNANLVVANSGDQTYGGTISGTGSVTKTGAGTLSLTGSNTYSGGTTINAGGVSVGSGSALGTGAIGLVNGATLLTTSAATFANAMTLGSNVNLSTGNVTTGNIHTPGLGLAGAVTLSGDLNSVALTVTGSSRVGITGVVGETAGQANNLVKRGTGTLELDNDNTYSGGTLVSQGTLVVNNAYNRTATGSGTGQGAVTIASGATLTGTYVIGGPVQVNGGGHLAVGNSIGTSTVSFLSLSGGSVLDFEIGTDGVTSDRLDIASLLSRNGSGLVTFALSGEHLADGSVNALSSGTFTLLTFGSENGFNASDFAATGLGTDWNYAFALKDSGYDASNTYQPGALTVTLFQSGTSAAAPEPSSLLFVFGPLGTLVGVALLRERGRKGAK